MKKTLPLILISFFLARPAYSESPTNTLRTWCILPENAVNVENARDIPDCGYQSSISSPLKQIWLKRPGSRCCVAIVEVEMDGTNLLNPKGFFYGPIPRLRDITPDIADQIWAAEPTEEIDVKKRSYKLESYGKTEDAFLDIVFENNKIEKYRIRSPELHSSDWQHIF